MTGYGNDENTIKEVWDGQVSGAIGNSEISTNTTWNTDKYVYNSVHVLSGHTLTINNVNDSVQAVIHMSRNAAIVVDSGAELIVNGARITNACDTCFWQGIVTLGNTDSSQTTTHQGKVTLNGATIEHATTGVCNWAAGVAGMNTAGGIIHAFNTRFVNCITGAKFDTYLHNLDYLTTPIAAYDAYFTNCTFEVNDDFKGHTMNMPFFSCVKISGVQGIKFEGCEFYNHDHNTQNVGRGYGVYTYDGGCRFQSHCTGITTPCTSWKRTKFTGFGSGIYATGTLSAWYTVAVDGTDFDSCTIGIKTDHFNNVTTTHSTFKIGDGLAQELFDEHGECTQNVGIWESYSEMFGIEGNTFTGVTYGGQPSGMQKIGVIVEHSAIPINDQHVIPEWQKRIFHNEVYKDSFITLNKGCWAMGPNAAGNDLDDNGLVFKCNAYVTNDSAIVVNAAWNEGIAYNQGNTDLSTGNTFSNSSGHNNYVSNNARPFLYYYYGLSVPEYPAYISPPQYIGLTTSSSDNACGDHYTSLPWDHTTKGIYKAVWNELKPRTDSLALVYKGRIDCGSTADLRAYIDTMTSDSATAVGLALMNCSPYLSREVVADVANMDILTEAQLLHILYANPDLLHDLQLLSYLASEIPEPLSLIGFESLIDSSSKITERTELQSQIAGMNDSLGWIGNLLITDMKQDTTYSDVDSIPVWLYKMDAEWADYDMVGYYYSRNNLDSAQAVLDSIPRRNGFDSLYNSVITGGGAFSATFGQANEAINYWFYTWIYSMVADAKSSGRGIDSLRSGEIDTLNELVTLGDEITNSFVLKAFKIASGLLNHASPWALPCPPGGIYTKQHKPGRTNSNDTISVLHSLVNAYTKAVDKSNIGNNNTTAPKANNVLKVYPNPANDFVVFDYYTPNTAGDMLLVISDTRGVKIKQFEMSSNTGQVRWETKNITPGIYFYQLTDAKQVIKTGKVTVMR